MENDAEPRAVSAYLVVDGGTVYELAPNSVLNIGRLDTNDIVLDDYKVSREHAMLKISGDEFMIVDLASTHGTYVNRERIDRAAIRFGDRIQIVNHELSLRPDLPPEQPGHAAVPSRMSRSLDRRLKFFGGLNEFALITLVQFLHQEKQSGLLLLEVGQKPGPRIYFEDGEITHVAEGDNLAELLVRRDHSQSLFFYFHHETNFPERNIMESTPNYLMALCHAHDEKQGRVLPGTTLLPKPEALTVKLVPPPPRHS